MRKSTEEINLVARVHSPDTGRILEVLTTEPGMQLYCGKFNDERTSKGGKQYKGHAAFCLETQHFPDSPNQAHFPSTIISPEKTFKSTTIYRFSA
jgi:aldose 1-epimerase